MTSKISFFNIAREDFRHKTWMLALSCLGSFLALPVLFLLATQDFPRYYMEDAATGIPMLYRDYRLIFTEVFLISEGIILVAGALIVAICGNRYLYSRKMSDLIHSVPVQRSKLFIAYWLNGLLIWLVPMVLNMLLVLILIFFNMARYGALAYFGPILATALTVMGIFLLAYVTVYHFCLVCVAFSGNAINALCSTLLLGAGAYAIYELTEILCNYFFATFVRLPLEIESVIWASPLANSVDLLYLSSKVLDPGGTASYPVLLLVMTLLMALVNWLLAAWLFVKRPSELAERGIQIPLLQHFGRILAAFLGSILGAIFFIWTTGEESIGWQFFGALLVGILAFGAADVIMNMNFRCFLAHKLEMALTIGLSFLLYLTFAYDWTGYDVRIPEKEEILSASIQCSEYRESYYGRFYDTSDGTTYLPDMQYQDADYIYELLEVFSRRQGSEADGGQEASENIFSDANSFSFGNSGYTIGLLGLEVKLKNGRTFLRAYPYKSNDGELLRKVLESDCYREAYYPVSSGLPGEPDSLMVEDRVGYIDYQIYTPEERSQLMEAYKKDFLEHYHLEELGTGIRNAVIELQYDEYPNRYFDLNVYDNYTNTLEVLRTLLPQLTLTAEDLKGIAPFTVNPDLSYDSDGWPVQATREALSSYFGIEGYPDYDTYLENLEDAGNPQETAVPDTANEQVPWPNAPKTPATKEWQFKGNEFSWTLEDPADLEALLPYLHVGSYSAPNFEGFGDQYVRLGYFTLANRGNAWAYVKLGELPEKWITKFAETAAQIQ